MDHPWQSIDLPLGWEMKYDPGQKRCFFLDHINKTTTWEDPRIKIWNERRNTLNNKPITTCHEHPQQENLLTRFPTARKETISLVLKSSHGDVDEACEMLKDMGYQEKKVVLASDNLFKTLSLLSRPDTLSPKSSSSAPANPLRPSSARSNSPISSARKTKTCYSETNSTISNSSEEDKKKNDKRGKPHKHGQTKKKSEKDKKDEQHVNHKLESATCGPSSQMKQQLVDEQNNLFKLEGNIESNSNLEEEQCVRSFATLSLGPNKSLVKGPDPNLRSGRSPTPRGRDSSLRCGPSPTNVCGPQKDLLKGPQVCLLGADTT